MNFVVSCTVHLTVYSLVHRNVPRFFVCSCKRSKIVLLIILSLKNLIYLWSLWRLLKVELIVADNNGSKSTMLLVFYGPLSLLSIIDIVHACSLGWYPQIFHTFFIDFHHNLCLVFSSTEKINTPKLYERQISGFFFI